MKLNEANFEAKFHICRIAARDINSGVEGGGCRTAPGSGIQRVGKRDAIRPPSPSMGRAGCATCSTLRKWHDTEAGTTHRGGSDLVNLLTEVP